jgi:L,D-transpeptidase ErfK/SrfK
MKKFGLLTMMTLLAPVAAHAAYDLPYMGEMKEIRAKYEDTFVYLARDYGLGFVEMRAANPTLDPWIPGEGAKVILPTQFILPDTPHKGIVINLPEMRMFAYINGDAPPTTYPIGIGREGLDTPLGVTTVTRKTAGPTWTPTARMRREKPELPAVMPPGPENPMGTHALYLGFPLVAIHGTNRAFGIGRRISSGCIRLYPEDIIALYNSIPVGTQVTVVNQPIKLAWIGDELFIEAHPEIDQAIKMEETGEIVSAKLSNSDMERIIKAAGPFKDRLRWPEIRKAVKERRGYPISIARRPGVDVVQQIVDADGNPVPEHKKKSIEKQIIRQEAAQALEVMYGGEEEVRDLNVRPEDKKDYAAKKPARMTLNP